MTVASTLHPVANKPGAKTEGGVKMDDKINIIHSKSFNH